MKCFVLLLALVAVASCDNSGAFDHWKKTGRAAPNRVLRFTIAVKQNPEGIAELDRLFWDLSNPKSENFAKWLTVEQVQEISAPLPEDKQAVIHWLRRHNMKFSDHGDFINARAPVRQLEEIFKGEFHVFRNMESGLVLIRNLNAVFPAELEPHVDFVTKLTELPPKALGSTTTDSDRLGIDFVVPQTIQAQYGVPSTPVTNSKASQAVIEFGKTAGVSIDDLYTFENNVNVAKQNISYTVGPFKFMPINPIDGESTLDIQYVIGVTPGADSSFWTVEGWMYDLPVLVQQRQQSNLPVPAVYSISYAWAESNTCEIVQQQGGVSCFSLGGSNQDYISRTNTEFSKMGTMGMTIMSASGDAGASGKLNQKCHQTNPPFNPNYPATSPYITTVGGTQYLKNGGTTLPSAGAPPFCRTKSCYGKGTEVACEYGNNPSGDITTGGGFSLYTPQPSYQTSDVAAWVKDGSQGIPKNYYNASNAGYPDVSALSFNYYIEENGREGAVAGTSASTPVFSAIVTRFNNWRLNNNKGTIGPLNQILYDMPSSCFTDITKGNNKGTEDKTCEYGYSCSKGWDPVTGLGTPVYNSMLNYIQGLKN